MKPRSSRAESKKWREHARAVVEHHLGSAPERIARQSGGISNFVYRVKHRRGEFVVRLSPEPHKLHAFRKEQFASERARSVGVPTAEVLLVGADVVPCPYMIASWVPGEIAVHHPDRLSILRQVGSYGALINSIALPGFGRNIAGWPNTPAPRATWAEFLREELGLEQRLEALVRHGMLDQPKVAKLRAVLETAALGAAHGQLNHGDLRLKNVLVDEAGKITAIIDWEHCLSALAPSWEWSIALHDLSIDAMEAFLGGYGAPRERVEELSPVVKALNIVNYVPAIERLIERGEQEPLGWIRTRMRGALDLYSM